jgi:hypothetical protein
MDRGFGLTYARHAFAEYHPLEYIPVSIVNGAAIEAIAEGTVSFEILLCHRPPTYLCRA